MTSPDFWRWYDAEAAPRLGVREVSFRKVFAYLDAVEKPVIIVETGCARLRDNWEGDGQSTILFDRYVRQGQAASTVHTIDLDPNATAVCRTLVSDRVEIHTGDSVALLRGLARRLRGEQKTIDLLYLDSFDLDVRNPTPSAVHHLKELVSIVSALRRETLVVVDDCALICRAISDSQNNLSLLAAPEVGGKGMYVAEYAAQVGAQLQFAHYQAGWTGLTE